MLQTRTIEPHTLGLLRALMAEPYLQNFYLVGGTALALQLGHRKSIDLDFFTMVDFDSEILLQQLLKKYEVSVINQTQSMLITTVQNIKVDFVKMAYPILFPTLNIEGIQMLAIKDIAPMKLKAIVQRGSKKDFYDIYFLLDFLSLDQIIDLFKRKFQQHEIFHVIKSLTYFKDAETYANPIVFDKTITWEMVKSSIRKTIKEAF